MVIRWQFIESYEGESSQWSWRIVKADGAMETQSETFNTYGLCVADAIRSGFQPRQQHWVVATRYTVTHFQPRNPPLSVPMADLQPSPVRLQKGGPENLPEAPKATMAPRRRETQ